MDSGAWRVNTKKGDRTKTCEVLEGPKGKQLTTTAHIYYQMYMQFSPTWWSLNI